MRLSLSTTTEGPLWWRKHRWWWEEGKRDRSAAKELGGVVSPSHRVISSISGLSVNTRKQYNFIIVSCKFFYCPPQTTRRCPGRLFLFYSALALAGSRLSGREPLVTAYLIISLTPPTVLEIGVQSLLYLSKVLSWIRSDTCSASSKAHMAERAYQSHTGMLRVALPASIFRYPFLMQLGISFRVGICIHHRKWQRTSRVVF